MKERLWDTNLIRYTLQFTRNRPQTLFGGIQWCTSWTTIRKTSLIHVNYPQQMTWQQHTGYVSFCTHQHPLVGSFLHTLYHAKNMSSWSAWCDGRIERINIGERVVCYSMSRSTTELHFDAAQAIASLTDLWWMLHNARSNRGFPWQWPSLLRLEQLQCLPLTMTFTTSKHAPTTLSCQNIGLFPM